MTKTNTKTVRSPISAPPPCFHQYIACKFKVAMIWYLSWRFLAYKTLHNPWSTKSSKFSGILPRPDLNYHYLLFLLQGTLSLPSLPPFARYPPTASRPCWSGCQEENWMCDWIELLFPVIGLPSTYSITIITTAAWPVIQSWEEW